MNLLLSSTDKNASKLFPMKNMERFLEVVVIVSEVFSFQQVIRWLSVFLGSENFSGKLKNCNVISRVIMNEMFFFLSHRLLSW